MDKKRLAYGRDRKASQFKAYDIAPNQFFLDVGDEVEEFEYLLNALRGGEVVVILSRRDLGIGAQISKREASIAERGATIELRDPPNNKPKKASKRFSDEETEIVCKIWANEIMPGASKLERIYEITGKRKSRADVYYWCVTRPKLQAAKKKKTQ